MTTIEEMDEFFNFDDATFDLQLGTSGPYDVDLAFAEPEADENSFTCLQHFSALEQQLSLDLDNGTLDTTMMGPDDFTDFPRWIDGMDVPTQPCSYCHGMRIHCKVLKEGLRKGSCTSCVALARSCSLASGAAEKGAATSQRFSQSSLPEGVCDEARESVAAEVLTQQSQDVGDRPLSEKPPMEQSGQLSHSMLAPKLVALQSPDENKNEDISASGPKIGARFSRESVRVLRGWLSTRHCHPYPSDEEKENLKRLTGLNKTQITNWLANARRRGKVRAPRSTSPSVNNYSNAMDIPRRATPGTEGMNPLERWKHSPPENEPASVTAIVKAVTSSTFSSGHESPYSYGHTDDGSNRSLCNLSSASSLGTSYSSGASFASAFSHKSRGSFGSLSSVGNRGRRRRRRQTANSVKVPTSSQPAQTFQCTFCTQTFKTKHDWQRHEKSLHLSLERWVCCPDGPAQSSADHNLDRCVFCGLTNPPSGHAEQHNYSSCVERSLEERTFYRKDHLRQHLNLVHGTKFQASTMDRWQVVTPEIRSRCGFCGIVMDSWTIRVDHLAEHFKGGKSMADWKGDWGFEPQVLANVENWIPPFLIHDERNSLDPYEAAKEVALPDRTLQDRVKMCLVEYVHQCILNGATPTDQDLIIEARKSIITADKVARQGEPERSWFRDLILLAGPQSAEKSVSGRATPPVTWTQKLGNIAAQSNYETDLTTTSCSKERALKAFVNAKQALGLTPTNSELQVEACRILDEIEKQSSYKCKAAVPWFNYLISASTEWLEQFRRRAGLLRSSDLVLETIRSTDDKSIDYATHNYGRLEKELADYVKIQLAAGTTPTDADLQRQARLIIYHNDDPWNQTAADDPGTLHVFKRQNGLTPMDDDSFDLPALHEKHFANPLNPKSHASQLQSSSPPSCSLHWGLEDSGIVLLSPGSGNESAVDSSTPDHLDQSLHTLNHSQQSTKSSPTQPLQYFLNDSRCYGRVFRELARFVTTSISPNNPNQHIPTDAELQHQARWIVYDDDDPWNQTAADNAEWLIRFKRHVGLAPLEDGPGLPISETSTTSWNIGSGGTGFSPPYVYPKALPTQSTADVDMKIDDETYGVKAKTVEGFFKSMGGRYQPPARVFCSRDLENGLSQFVKEKMAKGVRPNDASLQARAREILGIEQTAADDLQLLEKFKSLHGLARDTQHTNEFYGPFDDAMLTEFDQDIQDLNLSGLMGVEMFADCSGNSISESPSATAAISSDPMANHTQTLDPGSIQDYADLYRVKAATSSPFQRRASVNMAEQLGLVLPTPEN